MLDDMTTDMPPQRDKVRENRLRRMAIRQGIELRKCQRRDPMALDHGLWSMVWQRSHRPLTEGYELTSDEIERFLTRDRATYDQVIADLGREHGLDPDGFAAFTDRDVVREYIRITAPPTEKERSL